MGARRPASGRGFTLLEVILASAIFAIAVLATVTALAPVTDGYDAGVRISHIAEQARLGVDRMAEDIRAGERATTIVGPWEPGHGDRIIFQKMVGYVGDTPTYRSMEYRLETSPIDADRDGVRDDYMLVRIDNGVPTVLCHYVAEGGLTITRSGSRLYIRLTTRAAMPQGDPIQRFIETTVTLRN